MTIDARSIKHKTNTVGPLDLSTISTLPKHDSHSVKQVITGFKRENNKIQVNENYLDK